MGVFSRVVPKNTGGWTRPAPVEVAGSEQLRGFFREDASGCFPEDTNSASSRFCGDHVDTIVGVLFDDVVPANTGVRTEPTSVEVAGSECKRLKLKLRKRGRLRVKLVATLTTCAAQLVSALVFATIPLLVEPQALSFWDRDSALACYSAARRPPGRSR